MPVKARVVSERVEGEHVVSVVSLLDGGDSRMAVVRCPRPGAFEGSTPLPEVRDALAARARNRSVLALYAQVDAARRGIVARAVDEVLAALNIIEIPMVSVQLRALPGGDAFLASCAERGITVSGPVATSLRTLGAKPAAAL